MKPRDILLSLCAPLLLGFGFVIAKPKPKRRGAHSASKMSRSFIRDAHRLDLNT